MRSADDPRVLLALERPSPRLPQRSLSWPRRVVSAACLHAPVLAALLMARALPAVITEPVTVVPKHLTWVVTLPPDELPAARPSSSGGGGGNRRPAPALPEIPPVVRAAPAVVEVPAEPIEARPIEAGRLVFAAAAAPEGNGRGAGTGGGSGDGDGTGAGPGEGSGIGPGSGGGTGGGVYRPGGGVTTPVVLAQVRPTYPADAMRRRVQGSVGLDVIVRADGTPQVVRVSRPVDRGCLDEEAERAVTQWRFLPGRRHGVPVDVLVTVIVDFVLY